MKNLGDSTIYGFISLINRIGLQTVVSFSVGQIDRPSQLEKFRKQISDANPDMIVLCSYEERLTPDFILKDETVPESDL